MVSDDTNKPSENKSALNLLPCDHYDHEHHACSSFMGRLNNYYTGVQISREDCARFRDLFIDCGRYHRDPENNFDALLKLNKYENELMRRRADAARANDVWERRSRPPSDWNAPLPDWCQERIKNSSWYKSAQSPPPTI